MMQRWFVGSGSVLLLAIAVAACGGGGGGGTSIGGTGGGGSTGVVPPSTSGPVSTATGGTATMSLTIPNATNASSVRRARYISSATQSVAVFAYAASATPPPTATTLVNVGAGLPGCTTATTGTTCTLSVPAQYGSVTFVVKTYDGVLGGGNLLSQATITQTIAPGANNVPLTLSGIVAGTQIVPPQFSFPAGGGTFTLTVNALDANGAVIVGGGTYSTPILITSSDSAVTVSPATVTGPGQTVTVTYGASAASGVTLRARAAGLSPSAEGATDLSFSQPAASNLTAYILDDATNIVYGFPAGSNGVPGLQSRTVFPGAGGYNMLAVGVFPVGTSASPNFSVSSLYGGTALYWESIGGGPPQTLQQSSGTGPIAYDNAATSPTKGDLAVLHTSGSITYFAPNAVGTAAPLATVTNTSLQTANAFGIDGQGNVYVLQAYYPSAEVLVFPPGSSTPSTTIPIQLGTSTYVNSNAPSFAVSSDGTFAVNVFISGSTSFTNTYRIYGPYGSWALQRTIGGGSIGASFGGAVTFAPDDSLYFASGSTVSVYAPTANGTAPPSRSFLTSLANVNQIASIALGNPLATSTPAANTLSGDFLAVTPNRTWNYRVVPLSGSLATVTVYADPQPVNGNEALVAFVQPTAAPDALPADGGTLAAAAGLSESSDGYHAQTYGSVSNDSFGLIPGAPLIVPSTVTLGQIYIPYPGVTAVVRNIAPNLAGSSACPTPGAVGAAIYYTIGSATEQFFFVPGCGITRFVNDNGTQFILQSVGSHPELGQQTVARRTLNATYGDTLRSIWQALLVRK